jgi:FAD/FMN-containing dehydrogenase
MAADQILSLEVVLPNGTLVTANDDHNSEIFWAMRGGGGGTFGILTSAIVAAYPAVSVAKSTYTVTSTLTNGTVSAEAFWAGMRAFYSTFTRNADAGHYSYFIISCNTPDNIDECSLKMMPHWANNMTAKDLRAWDAPLMSKFAELGLQVRDLEYEEFKTFLDGYDATFPATGEAAGGATIHTGSRLFPRANWEGDAQIDKTAAAMRRSIEQGAKFLAYNMRPATNPRVNQTNAVNPAWRKTVLFAMMANLLPNNATVPQIIQQSRTMADLMNIWREVTPGAGAYLNEGDINEPNFQQSFYGSDFYPRLYALKQRLDPTGTFYAKTAVGSEDWYVTDQLEWYPTTNGKLCRAKKSE